MSVTTVRLQLEVESHFAAIASKLYSQKIAGMHICIAALKKRILSSTKNTVPHPLAANLGF